MPTGYETTRLWIEALGLASDDPDADAKSRLLVAHSSLRQRAALLADEIPQDLREFTRHDLSHLDALWELASEIGGSKIRLTPTEAFVLGAAFLVHDLGMGLAAYPNGMDGLKSLPEWDDAFAAEFRRSSDRWPDAGDFNGKHPEIEQRVKVTLLRDLHAQHGERLANLSWQHGTTSEFFLIDDVDLRDRYGELIGLSAASHGWDIVAVGERFGGPVIGAPVDAPAEWTVDALKLACLLRLSDAAHLDERRAPGFMRAFRKPSFFSDQHWIFQGFLQRARLEGDQLVFTSSRSVSATDSSAWWLCFDMLRMVDKELSGVDSLLLDLKRTRFAARRVRGVDNPRALAQLIRTDGWEPVDAALRVSDLPALVKVLGGAQLYGEDKSVALRELIQNARDASVSYAELTSEPRPQIKVAIDQDGRGDHWLTVSDDGVGMSRLVMTTTLVDFGQSLWGSSLVNAELQGLSASHFDAVGHFGIGFYAVFMLGDDVRVVSRRFDAGAEETFVLEFSGGVNQRPLFRPADRSEVRRARGGTSVSVRLATPPAEEGGLLHHSRDGVFSLLNLCARIAPALDCDLVVVDNLAPAETAVSASDWRTMPGAELLARLNPNSWDLFPRMRLPLESVAENLRFLGPAGAERGRLSLAPTPPAAMQGEEQIQLDGVGTIGGFAAVRHLGGVAGVVAAQPNKADRSSATLSVTSEEWKVWADEQVTLWREFINANLWNSWYSEAGSMVEVLIQLGADVSEIEVARDRTGPMTLAVLRQKIASCDEILVLHPYDLDWRINEDGKEEFWTRSTHKKFDLRPDAIVLLTSGAQYGDREALNDQYPDKRYRPAAGVRSSDDQRAWYYFNQSSIGGLIVRTVADAWSCPLEDLLAAAEVADRAVSMGRTEDGSDVYGLADLLIVRGDIR